VVLGIALGRRLERLSGEMAEEPLEGWIADEALERGGVRGDGSADGGQLGRRGLIEAAAQEGMAVRLNVEVVAPRGRPSALPSHERPHVGLVGRLVLGEAHVAVDPEGAILGPNAAEVLVLPEKLEHRCYEREEGRSGQFVALAIGLEPGTVVVDPQVPKEGERLAELSWHDLPILGSRARPVKTRVRARAARIAAPGPLRLS